MGTGVTGRFCRIVAGLVVCGQAAMLAGCDSGSPVDDLPYRSVQLTADCDPSQACRVEGGGLSAVIRLGPDIHALRPFPVTLESNKNLAIEAVLVSFSMHGMDMGSNLYRLETDGQGSWRAQVILPICVSGRSDWLAEFEVRAVGQKLQFKLPFILQK